MKLCQEKTALRSFQFKFGLVNLASTGVFWIGYSIHLINFFACHNLDEALLKSSRVMPLCQNSYMSSYI